MRLAIKSSWLFSFVITFLSSSILYGQLHEVDSASNSIPSRSTVGDFSNSPMSLINSKLAQKSDDESSSKSSSSSSEKKRQKAQKYKYWYLLPLGIPQFADGLRGGGAALALGQISMLALYYDRQQKIVAGNKATADVTRNTAPAQAASNPFILSFLNQNEKDVREAQKEARYTLFAFIGLYSFSIYEAIYDPFNTRKFAALRRQKRQMEHSRERSQDRDSDKNEDLDFKDDKDNDPEAKLRPKPSFNSRLGLIVVPDSPHQGYQLALTWRMDFL